MEFPYTWECAETGRSSGVQESDKVFNLRISCTPSPLLIESSLKFIADLFFLQLTQSPPNKLGSSSKIFARIFLNLFVKRTTYIKYETLHSTSYIILCDKYMKIISG